MKIKTVIDLVYRGLTQSENGSPIEAELKTQNVKCDLIDTFSQQYYANSERIMRFSRNFAVPVKLTEDIFSEGVRYELTYVDFEGYRYDVRNILNHRESSLMKILDCQELR